MFLSLHFIHVSFLHSYVGIIITNIICGLAQTVLLKHCVSNGFHCIACHCIACHCIACHCIACHCIACHCIACHCIACHVIACHVIACHVMSCHVTSCHCMSLHCMSDACHALHLAFTCNKPYTEFMQSLDHFEID